MKKGFTIVEIIISIGLIAIIGTVSIVFLTRSNTKKKEETISKVTNTLQEASSIYLSVNKETNSSILEDIQKGGTGYVIPIKTLLKEGYITENHIKTLQDNNVNIDIDKAYMLAAAFSDDQTKCTNNEYVVTIKPSYELEKNRNYYLCNFTIEKNYVYYDLDGGYFTDGSEQVTIYNKGTTIPLKDGSKVKKDDIVNQTYTFKSWNTEKNCGGEVITSLDVLNDNKIIYACYNMNVKNSTVLNKILEDNEIHTDAIDETKCQSGLYVEMDNDGATFFFRGNVNNNYIKYGKDQNGNDLLWRVLRINGDGTLRLILNENLKYYLKDSDGNKIEVNSGNWIAGPQVIREYSSSTDIYRVLLNYRERSVNDNMYMSYTNILNKTGYTFTVWDNLALSYSNISTSEANLYKNGYYYQIAKKWLDSFVSSDTNLTTGKYCKTGYYKSASYDIYQPNSDFKCDNNIYVDTKKDLYGSNTLETMNIGFLSKGEANMANNKLDSCGDNFINNGDSFLLSSFYHTDSSSGSEDIRVYDSVGGTSLIYDYSKTSCSGCQDWVYYSYNDAVNNGAYFKVHRGKESNFYLRNIRPVINLKKSVKLTGDGTLTNPYVIN